MPRSIGTRLIEGLNACHGLKFEFSARHHHSVSSGAYFGKYNSRNPSRASEAAITVPTCAFARLIFSCGVVRSFELQEIARLTSVPAKNDCLYIGAATRLFSFSFKSQPSSFLSPCSLGCLSEKNVVQFQCYCCGRCA